MKTHVIAGVNDRWLYSEAKFKGLKIGGPADLLLPKKDQRRTKVPKGLLKLLKNRCHNITVADYNQPLKSCFTLKRNIRNFKTEDFVLLRLSHMRGLVLGTIPCNKSRGQVPPCELVIFPSKSCCKDQLWSLRLVP